jgi:hypothetical protein
LFALAGRRLTGNVAGEIQNYASSQLESENGQEFGTARNPAVHHWSRLGGIWMRNSREGLLFALGAFSRHSIGGRRPDFCAHGVQGICSKRPGSITMKQEPNPIPEGNP